MPDISPLLPYQPSEQKLTTEFADALHDQIDPDFDEAAYLRTYPDVADTVQRGALKSGLAHYVLFGKAERRLELPQYRQNVSAQLRALAEFGASSGTAQAPA